MVILTPTIGSAAAISRYKFSGTISVEGSPAAKRVVALARETFSYVKGTMSESDGTWVIGGLPAGSASQYHTLLAIDDTDTYNVEAASMVQPVAE